MIKVYFGAGMGFFIILEDNFFSFYSVVGFKFLKRFVFFFFDLGLRFIDLDLAVMLISYYIYLILVVRGL